MTKNASTDKAKARRNGAAEIYRMAARLMESSPDGDRFQGFTYVGAAYSCIAIKVASEALGGMYGDESACKSCARYRNIFDEYFGPSIYIENRGHRITALCMMAAMVEAGDA